MESDPLIQTYSEVISSIKKLGVSVEAYQDILRAYGEIITAIPIPEETAKKIEMEISKLLGRGVYLKRSVDESILGGAIIRIGKKTIDGSLRSKLQQMKEKIAKGIE